MKKVLPLIALLQSFTASASLVGIMDSGTDMTHRDLAPKAWVNKYEKVGNKDIDGDGLPGDVRGYDFITNKPNPYDSRYNYLITNDVKTFFSYYAKYETKTISAVELQWLKDHSADEKLMNDVNFIGGYIHGTHVAGISTTGVVNAKILPMKVIPTEYQDVSVPAPTNEQGPSTQPVPDTTPTMSVDELKAELVKEATSKIDEMIKMHQVLKFHKVDAVNQSFGIGFVNALDFMKSAYIETQKKVPSDNELDGLARLYMKTLVTSGTRMYNSAPETLFCVAAGNDSNNNDLNPDYPSSVPAENKISVAATYGYSSLADFSNYGVNSVDVAAPGVAISSTAPTNTYIQLSGTSQATPFVTNTAAQMKDVNPNLKPREIKAIIMRTVDVKLWLRGKVKSSGIVNKVRAIKAASNMRTMSFEQAINQARNEIPDVVVPTSKSLSLFDTQMKPILGFKFTLKRPSLLIKK